MIFACCHPGLSPPGQVALTLKVVGGFSFSEIARAFLAREDADRPAAAPGPAAAAGARGPPGDAATRGAAPASRRGPRGGLPDVQRGLLGARRRRARPHRPVPRGHPPRGAAGGAAGRASPAGSRPGRAPALPGVPAPGAQRAGPGAAPPRGAGPLAVGPPPRRPRARALSTVRRGERALAPTTWRPRSPRVTPWPRATARPTGAGSWPPTTPSWSAGPHRWWPSTGRSPWPTWQGPGIGLEEIERLRHTRVLRHYHPLHAARGELLRRLGRHEEAADAFRQALALTSSEPVRRFLARRIGDARDDRRRHRATPAHAERTARPGCRMLGPDGRLHRRPSLLPAGAPGRSRPHRGRVLGAFGDPGLPGARRGLEAHEADDLRELHGQPRGAAAVLGGKPARVATGVLGPAQRGARGPRPARGAGHGPAGRHPERGRTAPGRREPQGAGSPRPAGRGRVPGLSARGSGARTCRSFSWPGTPRSGRRPLAASPGTAWTARSGPMGTHRSPAPSTASASRTVRSAAAFSSPGWSSSARTSRGPASPRWRALSTQADALLVVGSSLMVWSGYRFVRAARERGLPVAAVNLGRTRADEEITLKVEGDCAEVLPAALR